MPDHRFPGFPNGINNVFPDDKIPNNALAEARNVDLIGPEGRIKRRAGTQRVYTGADLHSLHATPAYLLGVEGGVLKRWTDPAGSPAEIESGVGDAVSYADVNGGVVWSSRNKMGFVGPAGDSERFGVDAPDGQPTVEAVAEGGWHAGTIMLAITYGAEGLESGTGEATYVTVSEGQAIQLTNIPQSSTADDIHIYCTDPDGTTLYYRTTVPMGTTTYTLGYKRARRALRSQFMDTLPAGQIIARYNGFLFSARDNTVHFSEPMAFWLSHTIEGYFAEASDVTLLLPGDTGVFVGCDEGVFFYRGNSPQQFTRDYVSSAPIPGASLSVDGGFINPRYQGQQLALWWTVDGAMIIGLPDGSSEIVRDTEFRIPNAERGTMAQVTRDGVKQVVSVMQNPKAESSLSFNDEVTIEVHRNGVTL